MMSFGIPGIPSGKTTGSPSKGAADQVKSGNTSALAYPNFFPNGGAYSLHKKRDGRSSRLRKKRKVNPFSGRVSLLNLSDAVCPNTGSCICYT